MIIVSFDNKDYISEENLLRFLNRKSTFIPEDKYVNGLVFHAQYYEGEYCGFVFYHNGKDRSIEADKIIEQHDLPLNLEEWTEDQKMLFRLSLT
jgi:hypothetical protein